MVIAIVPVLVALLGLLLWLLASNPKVAEIGKILFFCGTFALCLSFASETVTIGMRGK